MYMEDVNVNVIQHMDKASISNYITKKKRNVYAFWSKDSATGIYKWRRNVLHCALCKCSAVRGQHGLVQSGDTNVITVTGIL